MSETKIVSPKDAEKFLKGLNTKNLVALYTVRRTKKGLHAGFAQSFKNDKERENIANFLIEQAIDILGADYIQKLFIEELNERNKSMYG